MEEAEVQGKRSGFKKLAQFEVLYLCSGSKIPGLNYIGSPSTVSAGDTPI